MLIPALTGGGAERQAAMLSEGLLARGHEVQVGCVAPGPGRWPAAVPTHRLARRHSWSPVRIQDIARWIRSAKPDVVQTCLTPMDVAGGAAAVLCGVPWILRECSSRPMYGRDLRSRVRVASVRRGAAAVIANSDGGAAYWAEAAPRIPRHVIRNGCADAALACAQGGRRGLYVGRLVPGKNVDIVLRAAARAGVELDICGEGPLRADLERLAGDLGMAARVRFHGFVRDPAAFRRTADFGILVSQVEGHPNAVAEAFAASMPMILSDIDVHREIAADGDALFAPPRDVAATAAAMRQLLDDGEAARRRARNARERVAGATVAAMAEAYEAVYRSVLTPSVAVSQA